MHVEHLESRVLLDGGGLTAQYFHNPDFTGLAVERVEAVNFAWGTGSPVPWLHPDSFSVRWIGQVEAEYSETYTFRTLSDDGVRLWVDGQLLVDNWTTHSLQANTGTITLAAGQKYDLRLEYFDNAAGAEIRLQWQSASQPLEAIPASQLYASPAGVWGEYSDSFGGQATRIDSTIDFDWGLSRPMTQIAVDNFSVRWTGLIRPEHSEEYTFSTLSDEGVRVWIGDELIIDHWAPHTATFASGTKALEAGKWYDLRVEYRDVSSSAQVELYWSGVAQTGGQLEIIPSTNLLAAKHTPLMASNPLGQGQDPFVIRWQDKYLHVHSGSNSVSITAADELQDVHRNDPDARTVRVWRAPTGTNYSAQIWAPELHLLDGKWYIYVAASDGNNATHRMHVLERDDPDPMGPFTYKGQLAPTTDRWAIDGTVLNFQGQLYFIWSGWPGTSDGQQNLYIAEMSNPWTISGNRVLLAQPTLSWERHGLPINEGPQVLFENGQLHIIYSASGYWTPQYALGRLTYNRSGPIMSASSWTKQSTPVFQATSEVVGVGHASFTKSPDGTEDWIVYHAHPSPGGNPDARVIRIQTFTWTANGVPSFGSPLPADSRVAVPSGTADADRPLLPGDFDANGVVNSGDLATFRAQIGLEVFPGHMMSGRDLLVWQTNLGATATISAMATAASGARAAEDPQAVAPLSNLPLDQPRAVSGMDARPASSQGASTSVSSRRYERAVDRAVAIAYRTPHRRTMVDEIPWNGAAKDGSFEEAVWDEPHPVVDGYLMGADGAWLMSIGAGRGESFVGEPSAIDPTAL